MAENWGPMSSSFRHPEILRLARQNGEVTVDGLAAHFDVTLQTIRRDLADLASNGQLERVHGGAVLPSGISNIAYEERRQVNKSAKRLIGECCAALLPENACLFLGIGTTSEAVAQALQAHRNMMIVTNNTNVARMLSAQNDTSVILTGGTMRAADGGLTGPLTLASLQNFSFDAAVMGCSAIDPTGQLADFDLDEVRVSQCVLEQTRHSILVADHSKFARHAPVRLGPITYFDAVISDAALSPVLTRECAEKQTEVHISQLDETSSR